MQEEKRLIRFDWAAKYILRDKSNFDILEGFLSALLGKDITIINLLESESNQENETDKLNRVDLLTVDDTGEYIIIEIQNEREIYYLERLLYGTSKLIVENMKRGEPYQNVKKVISISILYFALGEKIDDYVYYGNTEFRGIHTKSSLTLRRKEKEMIKEMETKNIYPEYYLIEVEKFEDIIQNDFDEWMYFLKNESIKDDFKSKNIQKAQEKLKVIKMPEEARKRYDRYLNNVAIEYDVLEAKKEEIEEKIEKGREKGREEGREKGREEGREEGKRETARNMIKFGMEIEVVAKITGLTINEIQ